MPEIYSKTNKTNLLAAIAY
jgi:hypothetical protein